MAFLLLQESPELVLLIFILIIVLAMLGIKYRYQITTFALLLGGLTFFYRAPEREPLGGFREDTIYSPCDGTIMEITPGTEMTESCGADLAENVNTFTTVVVFLSPLNMHVQYAPCDCNIVCQKYFEGKFNPAFYKKTAANERMITLLDTNFGPIEIWQIAGCIVRSISSFVKSGQFVKVGALFGMIKFGSQVRITIPVPETAIKCKVGQKIYAGITPIVTPA
jgi:phosphatidylserine decarboxylase